ncbi:aspartyl aminopeptidase [Tieghemostelium lacteum]|uniref:aspartyl aminopeptidase n=1 Tax=Tieghemostelium lacteum TaxID=361077 RepID=A0A151ZIL5_TIELA|nr:aspartyl aminopeptidase [Tieghemostelium lacteum]|eukprot:KYQ93739.1 aspartyl aminopeptidase [Tieghemostelium lacteum]
MESFIPLAKDLTTFIDHSPSPYHAVSQFSEMLKANGFIQLSEKQIWDIKPNHKYFFTRNQSCLSAFAVGGKFKAGNGFNIAAAHTDSPNLKVRPVSTVESVGYLQVGCETYGGGLWYTWFDRDLTVAGRVIVKVGDQFESKLVHIKKPILRVPSLAIHLDRTVTTDGFKPNTQNHLVPMIANKLSQPVSSSTTSATDDKKSNTEDITKKHHSILLDLIAKELKCQPSDIQNFDLSVCDTQPAAIGGAYDEFIFSPRLDNLGMSFCAIKGLIDATNNAEALAQEENVIATILFDHEEVGSSSPQGACSPLTVDTINRVNQSFLQSSDRQRDITSVVDLSTRNSFLISADMAHAVHPNYSANHDPNHRPAMNKGPVIKYNANLRYATNNATSFVILEICKNNGIPVQEFLVKNDSPCGSTIGPIISGGYGIRTVDLGNPQLSMHSIRETTGTADITHGKNLIQKFFEQFTALDKKLNIDQ